MALGHNAGAIGEGTVAIGANVGACNAYSTVIGYWSYAYSMYSTVLGSGASDMGFINSVALGAGTRNTAPNQVHIGNRTLSGLADGIIGVGSTDAVTGNQIEALLSTQSSIDARQDGLIQALLDAPIKRLVYQPGGAPTIDYLAVSGGDAPAAVASGENAIAVGAGASALHDNSVAIGAGTVTTATDQVNVGGRTVSGVNPGTISSGSTDAVNGGQLFATNSRVEALESGMAGMDVRMEAFEATVLNIDADLRSLDRKIDGSTAVAIAMSGNAFLPDKRINMTGNVGTYRGAWAGALQVGAIVSQNLALNAAVAKNFNRRGSVGARAGFSVGW